MRRGDRHVFIPIPSGAEHPTLESVQSPNPRARTAALPGQQLGVQISGAGYASAGRRCWLSITKEASLSIAFLRQPMEIGAISPIRSRPVSALRQLHGRGLHSQGHQVTQRARRPQDWARLAHRLRHCVASPARAPTARTSRVHLRNARLHGARADGTSEPLRWIPGATFTRLESRFTKC